MTLVGYILTWYGKREINVAKTDIDTYWNWDRIAKEKGVRPMGLDGIFVDEVTCNGENMEYYETLYSYIKSKMWRSGSPGLLPRMFLTSGYVLLNPGCAPRHDAYYNICDLVIVFEHFHNNFMNPPLDDWAFQHLVDHCSEARVDGTHPIIMEDQTNGTLPMASEPVDERLFDSPTPVSDSPIPVSVHGMKLMLPKSSDAAPISKFGLMDHDFLPGKSQHDKVAALKSLVFDLVQVKRIGAIFITDIEIGKGDIYANWSSFWREFIDFVAEANCIAPDYDV